MVSDSSQTGQSALSHSSQTGQSVVSHTSQTEQSVVSDSSHTGQSVVSHSSHTGQSVVSHFTHKSNTAVSGLTIKSHRAVSGLTHCLFFVPEPQSTCRFPRSKAPQSEGTLVLWRLYFSPGWRASLPSSFQFKSKQCHRDFNNLWCLSQSVMFNTAHTVMFKAEYCIHCDIQGWILHSLWCLRLNTAYTVTFTTGWIPHTL